MVRNYLIVTASYWGFTLVDGALRIVKNGISATDRVIVGGVMRALPGNTVVPVTATAAADKAGK